MSLYIQCTFLQKLGFFKENFSETIRYIRLKFSKITELIMLLLQSNLSTTATLETKESSRYEERWPLWGRGVI